MSNEADILEKEIEAKLRKGVMKKKGLCLKLVTPGFNGMPDRICFFLGGKLRLVECKRPVGGKLSPIQKVVHQMLGVLGFPVTCVFNDEDLKEFLESI